MNRLLRSFRLAGIALSTLITIAVTGIAVGLAFRTYIPVVAVLSSIGSLIVLGLILYTVFKPNSVTRATAFALFVVELVLIVLTDGRAAAYASTSVLNTAAYSYLGHVTDTTPVGSLARVNAEHFADAMVTPPAMQYSLVDVFHRIVLYAQLQREPDSFVSDCNGEGRRLTAVRTDSRSPYIQLIYQQLAECYERHHDSGDALRAWNIWAHAMTLGDGPEQSRLPWLLASENAYNPPYHDLATTRALLQYALGDRTTARLLRTPRTPYIYDMMVNSGLRGRLAPNVTRPPEPPRGWRHVGKPRKA